MNQQELNEFARVQNAARNLASAIATGDAAKLVKVKELSFAEAYNIIYTIAMRPIPSNTSNANLYGTGEDLYLKFQQLLAELVRLNPINPQLASEALFRAVIQKWNNFQIIEKWMLKAFQYISRFYVPHLSKPPLSFLSLVIFNQEVFKKFEKTVNTVLLSDIQKLRNGENVDQERMKDAVKLLLKMGFGDRMSPEFVKELLASSATYYREESKRCIASCAVVEYTRKVHTWLTSEQQLSSWVLPDSGMQLQFLGEIERETIAEHLAFILESPEGGFISLMRAGRTADLKFLLQIMIRPQASGIAKMAELLKKECSEEGERTVLKYSTFKTNNNNNSSNNAAPENNNVGGSFLSDADAKSFVADFIALQDKYSELVTTCLNHSSFNFAVKEAFELTINMPVQLATPNNASVPTNVSSSELLARYSDMLMRGGPQHHLTDAELDQTLTKVVTLFARINDKDEFFEFVRNSLSRRLLSGSSNDDKERMFLSKFRAKVGASSTNKLEGMLHDIDGSRALTDAYQSSADRRSADFAPWEADRHMNFSPLLLTQAYWPTMSDETLVVPGSVKKHMDAFTTYYCTGRHHRQLKWVFQFGSAVINCNLPAPNTCELLLNLYQAAVICAFNHREEMNVADMMAFTGLQLEEVSRHIHSFATTKVGGGLLQIFVGNGTTTELQQGIKIPLDEGQIIRLNTSSFNPAGRKVRVPALVPKNQNNFVNYVGGLLTNTNNNSAGGGGMGSPSPTGGMMTAENTATSTMGQQQTTSMGAAAHSGLSAEAHQQQLERQRTPTVEAAIMKVMKSRQRLEHQVLITTVMDHLVQRFKPDPKFVKQCIESLLNRELIQRDPKDPNVYVFLTS